MFLSVNAFTRSIISSSVMALITVILTLSEVSGILRTSLGIYTSQISLVLKPKDSTPYVVR